MFIKIYFDEVPVLLTDFSFTYKNVSDQLQIDNPNDTYLNNLLLNLPPQFKSIIIRSENFKDLKERFFKRFTIILAGGGVVFNDENEILMIFRRGKWDLPKGKLDPGENIEECALREVAEETGLLEIDLLEKLTTTYHTYVEKGQHILKESHWYLMRYLGNATPIPQIEEQITEIKWVDPQYLDVYYKNTYPVIKEIISLSNF